MTYSEDHRRHMAHEIDRQDQAWRALNRRERRKVEYMKILVIVMLLIVIAVLLTR